jgi:two-component system, cell cycle sensor histidine kinase PleC
VFNKFLLYIFQIMSGRIFPIIASVILIAIVVTLFKFSLPKTKNGFESKKAEAFSVSKIKDFFGNIKDEDKKIFASLPCRSKVQCPDASHIKEAFEAAFNGGVIKRGLILDKNGAEIFTGKSLDPKYTKLILEADKKGSSFLKEMVSTQNNQSVKMVKVLKIFDSVGEDQMKDKFLLALIDSDKLDISKYNLIFGLVIFIPVAFVVFQLMLSKGSATAGKNSPINKSQDYLAQIEELKKLNANQSQFVANFTHELRTPLNSIIGFSGLLKDQTLGSLGNPEYVKYANDINTSGAHLLSLINDILDYSKSEAGKLKVNITEVDVIKVIKQALSIISPRASESKVDLLQSFSNDYFILRLDPKRFKQIMLNLLSNSVKFTPEGGAVTVSVFPDLKGDRVSIEIKDTGVGIAEKDIPTVMSLFGQVETDLNRKYEGTGIGLPFAKKLTGLMGGTFDLKSKVGEGTTVTLNFPYDKRLNVEYQELYKKQTS